MGLYDKLFDWQKNIVNKIKDRNNYGLFLDMGLGKTIIAMSLAEINNCTKVIVVTINSKAEETIENPGSWLEWASKSNIPYELYSKKDLKKTKYFLKKPEIIVVNYEGIYERNSDINIGRKKKDRVVELKQQLKDFVINSKGENVAIILDESHKIKDTSSLQTKAINKLKTLTKMYANETYLYLATGTPFTQGFIDLYSQLKLLECPLNKGEFEEKYCVLGNIPGLLQWQQPIVGYRNVDDLYNLIHQYAITIKSEEVIDLPEQIFINHKLPMSNEFKLLITKKANKKMVEELIKPRLKNVPNLPIEFQANANMPNPFYRNIDYPKLDWFAETSAAFWLRARQISIGFQGNEKNYEWYNKDRVKALKEFLEENEDNYIIFYNYTPELFEIYKVCEELDYNIDIYCGEIKQLFHYDKFENLTPEQRLVTKKNVIIANWSSGSTGKNWQLYNHCILFSIPLYREFAQGIKRINRIGSKEPAFYHTFYQDNWLDNKMLKALNEKQDYSKEMFEMDLNLNEE